MEGRRTGEDREGREESVRESIDLGNKKERKGREDREGRRREGKRTKEKRMGGSADGRRGSGKKTDANGKRKEEEGVPRQRRIEDGREEGSEGGMRSRMERRQNKYNERFMHEETNKGGTAHGIKRRKTVKPLSSTAKSARLRTHSKPMSRGIEIGSQEAASARGQVQGSVLSGYEFSFFFFNMQSG